MYVTTYVFHMQGEKLRKVGATCIFRAPTTAGQSGSYSLLLYQTSMYISLSRPR